VQAEKSKPLAKAASNTAKEFERAGGGLGQLLPSGELRTLFKQAAGQVSIDKRGREALQVFTNGFIARLTEKGFGEQDEYAADAEAVEQMAAAGYAPEEYVAFLSKLPDKGLSTEHPRRDKRQSQLRAQLAELRKRAPGNDFVTSVDLSQTQVIPLRDALQAGTSATAAHND